MNADDRARFAFLLAAIDSATSQQEVWELRREAETIAKAAGLSFDQALRAHRVGWPASDDDDGDEDDEPDQAGAIACELSSNVVIDDAVDEAQVEAAYPSTTAEIERVAAVKAALAADPDSSDRSIARSTNTSPTTVAKVRSATGLQRLVRTVKRGASSFDMAVSRRDGEPESTA